MQTAHKSIRGPAVLDTSASRACGSPAPGPTEHAPETCLDQEARGLSCLPRDLPGAWPVGSHWGPTPGGIWMLPQPCWNSEERQIQQLEGTQSGGTGCWPWAGCPPTSRGTPAAPTDRPPTSRGILGLETRSLPTADLTTHRPNTTRGQAKPVGTGPRSQLQTLSLEQSLDVGQGPALQAVSLAQKASPHPVWV